MEVDLKGTSYICQILRAYELYSHQVNFVWEQLTDLIDKEVKTYGAVTLIVLLKHIEDVGSRD